MNNTAIYITELNMALTIFFVVYLLLFRKDANFSSRRYYLLFSLVIAFLLPVINIRLPATGRYYYTPVFGLEEIIFTAGTASPTKPGNMNVSTVLAIIYLVPALFFTVRFFAGLTNILYQYLRSEKLQLQEKRYYASQRLHASSFFKVVFIDPEKESGDNFSHILQHEYQHVRLWHSIDRLLAEIMIILCWFNPLVWMIKKSMIVNHEYQADQQVVEQGTDHNRYQLSILNQFMGSTLMTNQFSNQIKNRINMLNKNLKKGSSRKGLWLLPVSLILFFFIACSNEKVEDGSALQHENAATRYMVRHVNGVTVSALQHENAATEKEIFYMVEEMPQWPGSDDMILSVRQFIAENLVYPDEAKLNGAQGKVFIHFLVTKTGDVVVPTPDILPPEKDEKGNPQEVEVVVFRPIEGEEAPAEEYISLLKEESIRVMNLMPDMIPGKQQGKNVNVIFTMPITFRLN